MTICGCGKGAARLASRIQSVRQRLKSATIAMPRESAPNRQFLNLYSPTDYGDKVLLR